MVIPLRVADHSRATGAIGVEQLIVLNAAEQSFELPMVGDDPVVSINRGYTAPVIIERTLDQADLVFLAAHDDDPFARCEAMQELAVSYLVDAAVAISRVEMASKWMPCPDRISSSRTRVT